MIDFGGKYLFSNHHEDENYIKICSEQMNNSMRSFMLRFMIMLTTFTIGYTKMNYATIVMGIKTTMLEVKIPFTEEKSNEEFLANYVLQTIIASFGFFGYFGMEIAMELMVIAIAISPKLITFEFQKLIEVIENGQLTPSQVCFTFRNIVQQVMDIDKYKSVLNTLKSYIFTVYSLDFFSSATKLYLQVFFICVL